MAASGTTLLLVVVAWWLYVLALLTGEELRSRARKSCCDLTTALGACECVLMKCTHKKENVKCQAQSTQTVSARAIESPAAGPHLAAVALLCRPPSLRLLQLLNQPPQLPAGPAAHTTRGRVAAPCR